MYHRSPYILSLCSLRESDRSCIAYQARPFYEREQRGEIGEERNTDESFFIVEILENILEYDGFPSAEGATILEREEVSISFHDSKK